MLKLSILLLSFPAAHFVVFLDLAVFSTTHVANESPCLHSSAYSTNQLSLTLRTERSQYKFTTTGGSDSGTRPCHGSDT